MRDLASLLQPVSVVAPAVYTSSPAAVPLDFRDANGAVFSISVGAAGIVFSSTNSLQFALQDSEDGVTYADVDIKNLNGADKPASVGSGGVILSFTAAKAAATLHEIGYIGGKKYLRAALLLNGTHATGTPVSVVAIKGHLARVPA